MHPYFQRLMMARKYRERQIIEVTQTTFTVITLPFRVFIMLPAFAYVKATTAWAIDALRPTQLPELLVAFFVIKEIMELQYHSGIVTQYVLLK